MERNTSNSKKIYEDVTHGNDHFGFKIVVNHKHDWRKDD